MSNKGKRNQPTSVEAELATVQIQTGLMEGNLKKLVARVDSFKKEKAEREAKRKSKIITPETIRQEAEARELEKFMDFTAIFGEYAPYYSECYKEPMVLSPPKEFRYDITRTPGEPDKIRYRNIRYLIPLRILQQIYAWSKRKDIIIP